MRLTCPNCGAQYEVPDDVIPAEGRDVQCSDCGTTWFQDGPYADEVESPEARAASEGADMPASEEMSAAISAAVSAPAPEDADTHAPAQEAADELDADVPDEEIAEDYSTPDTSYADESDEDWADPGDAEEFGEDVTAEEASAPEAERPKRMLDASVADILREEAEREVALRSAEASGLETQPDLGLEEPPKDDIEQRAQQTRERMARLRGEDPDAEQDDFAGSRRGLLPDIEEINSSLRSGGGYEVPAAAAGAGTLAYDEGPDRRQRGGFLRGFTVAVILAVVAALVYQNADMISGHVPEAAPALDAYVNWVNETRIWLHAQVEQLAQEPQASTQ